jgi:hypothetical protein
VKQLVAQILASRKVWRVSLVSAFATGCALGLWMLGGTTLLLLVIFSGAGLALSSVSPRLMENESASQPNTRRAGPALPSHLKLRKSLRRTIEVPLGSGTRLP